MPLHSYISIKHFHKKSVPVFSQGRIFFMAVSTAFPPACYKSGAFCLNRANISLWMGMIPAKICMDKHFWHGIGCLERLQCQKNPPLCFHKDGFFHGCFHLFFHISWSSFRAFHFENIVIICICHWLLGSDAVAV